jgi:hypothetical protein
MKYIAAVLVILGMISAASAVTGTADHGTISAVVVDAQGDKATSYTDSYDVTYTGWSTSATLAGVDPTSQNSGKQDVDTSGLAWSSADGIDKDTANALVQVSDTDNVADGGFSIVSQTATTPAGTVQAGQTLTGYIDNGQIKCTVMGLEGIHAPVVPIGNLATQGAYTEDFDTNDGDWGKISTTMTATADQSGSNGGGYVTASQDTKMDTDKGFAMVWGYSASDAFHIGENSYSMAKIQEDFGDGSKLDTVGLATANDLGSGSKQTYIMDADFGWAYADAYVVSPSISAIANAYWVDPNLSGVANGKQDGATPYAGIT